MLLFLTKTYHHLNRIVIVVVLLLCSLVHAGAADYQFHSLGIRHGLSNNSINSMMVDSKGFLWIGTAMGLNRYDGYEVRAFRYLDDKNTVPASNVNSIKEDAMGNLWVFGNSQLVRFDAVRQEFHVDNTDFFQELGIKVSDKCKLEVDDVGNLCLVDNGLITYYDYARKKKQQWKVALKITDGEWQVVNCAEGLYICDGYSLWKFTSRTGQLQPITMPQEMAGNAKHIRVYVDSENSLWMYSTISEAIYHYRGAQLELPHTGGSNAIRDIYDDEHGNIWIATDHNGVFVFSRQGGSVQHIIHQHNDGSSITSDNVTCITSDRQGTMWLGHYKTGISFTNKNYSLFQNRGLQFGDISTMLFDRNGDLWVGTDGNGAYIEHADGTFTKAGISDITISSFLVDHNGTMWVGAYNNGLYRMQGSAVAKEYTHENSMLRSNAVWQMEEDNHHNIWMASGFAPLAVFSIDTEKTALIYDGNSTVLAFSLAFDGRHTMYCGTYYGIWVYDTDSKRGYFMQGNRSGTQKLLQPAVVSLCYDRKRDALWVAHSTGITVYDVKKDQLQYIDSSNGLFNNYVKTIIADKQGNMWLSTGHGISCVQSNTKGEYVVHNFTSYEGLQNTYFNTFSATCSASGDILMGGNEGYTLISPKTIFANKKRPHIILTEVKVGDNYIIPEDSTIQISYDDYQILFRFFTGNLISSNRVTYAYRLRDTGSDWIYTDKNTVSFFSLPYGKHILEVKAAYEDGEWGEVTTVVIDVAPPFYLSWWMMLVYACIILLAIYYIHANIKSRQQKRMEEQRVHIEEQQKAQLSEMKLRFFTNISHDLRTPLTLIISPLQSMIQEMKAHSVTPQPASKAHLTRLEMIYKNAQLLYNQISMLLDFRRLDVGAESLRLQSIDVAQYLANICLSFHDYAEERRIALSYSPVAEHLYRSVDAEKLNKIMYNLLSNAFKFTPDGGSITVTLATASEDTESPVVITVKDTGCGIPDADKATIFQRFYQVRNDDAKAGSGIGLHIVKEYVTMHGGTVSVDDNKPSGSAFIITLPYHNVEKDGGTMDQDASPAMPEEITLAEDTAEEGDGSTTVRIMVVDDNNDLCTFIADSLRTAYPDYDIITADDGEQALQRLQREDVTLVVTDIMMPKVDGLELCKRIKTNISWSHIPVIMLTAKSTDMSIVEGLKLGADDYITKPFNIEHLKLRIEKFLEWTRSSHETFQRKIEIEPSEITITSLDEEFVKNAIQIVEEHMSDSDFSVEQLGKTLNMSRANLYKKMMSITGKGPHEFMRSIRLKRAHQLLEKSQRQISEIAYEVGFSSPKRFSENFKAEYGMTPSEFARSARK